MKKSIFLFFAAILCAMTANAYNQAAKDLYFDNSEAKWEKCYVYIGKSDYTSCYDMTRVIGTQYLWQLPANFNGGKSWNGATGWVVCYEKWWASANETIDKYIWHGDNNVTKKSTSAWVDTKIYKTNGAANATSDGTTKKVYTVTSYAKNNYTVTINTVEGGTLTVKDYDNNDVATGASKIHLTVLKFSAAPASGYVLEGVQINDGSTTTISASEINTKTHTLTSNVTITPVWKATTSTVTITTSATNGTVTGGGVVEEGTSVTLTATPADGYKFVNWTVGGAEVSTANPYTFTAEADVEVVANFEELPKTTVYFVNTPGWTNVKAYAYSPANASWPGVDATLEAEKIGDFDVYSYTATEGKYANVIFNGNGGQTADLTWSEGVDKYYIHDYNKNTGWYTKADAEALIVTSTPEPVVDETIYFVNNKNWTTINVYAWGGTASDLNSWPGKPVMTKTAEKIGEYEVYSLTATQGSYKNIIFNDGSAQTADYVWSNGKYYWVGKNANFAGETKENAETALATQAEDYYTVVGEGCPGLTWTPGDENNKMEKQSDNSYKLVKAGVELTTNVQWKITKNGDWWNGPTFNSANQVLSITKSGIYDVTFTLSADLNTATATADLKEETNTVADCYISGNPALTGTENGWAGNEFKMEYNEATSTYEYTLTGLAANTEYEFKVVLGGSWLGYDKIQTVPTGVENKGGNIGFKLAEAGDVVVTYNTTNGITLSGNFAAPAPEVPVTLYFVNADKWTNLKAHIWVDSNGESYKSWEESESLTDTGNDHNGADIYSYTFSNKYNRIIWKGDDKQTGDEVATYDVAKPYYCQGVWYASLSEILAPAETKYYIAGTQNLTGFDWQVDGLEIAKAGDVYKHTFSELPAGTYEFKVTQGDWNKESWGYYQLGAAYEEVSQGKDEHGNDNGNIKFVTEAAKNITVIFDPAAGKITIDGLTEKVVEAPKCYLMGNGDWTNGVEMTLNPDNNNEYMLLNHTITDAFKFKYGEEWSDQVENYDFPGIDWKEGNIVLPEGIYDFYFKIDTKKVYIAGVYLRDVTNTWGTICLPHASTNFSGATFYEVSSLDPTKGLWLDELAAGDQLVAGKPYVFEATGATVKVTYTDAAVAAPIAGEKGLIGTFTDIAAAAGSVLVGNYIIAQNAVHVATASNDLPANRAYINAASVPTTTQAEIPGRRRVCMGENAATGLDQIVAPEGQTIKAIVNGQLVIIRGGEMYNVQGQKL